jgi:hypothetical protein
MTSGAGSPRAFLWRTPSGTIRRGGRHGDAEAEDRSTHEHEEGAEAVLLADALAVRAVIARMEQAIEQGVGERLP